MKGGVFRLAALGDSLTEGWGLSPARAWPARAESLLKARGLAVKILNHGISGDTSLDGVARLGYVLDDRPAGCVVQFGANDLMQGLPLDLLERNLDTILTRLAEHGVRALLAGTRVLVPLDPEPAREYADLFVRVAGRHGVAHYPCMLEGVLGHPGLVQADGVHPTDRGMEEIAVRLLPLLEALVRGGSVRPR